MPRLTPQQTVRLLILGLPIGLIITGIIAMIIYFKVDDIRASQDQRSPVRRLLAEADLRDYVRTFASGIGSRHAGNPETLSSASKFIQSTLGPANMGFKVSRHEFETNGQTFYNLIIELPGAPGPRASEIILLTASYDSVALSPGANTNASGMAALMSLAQSFGGVASGRTIRFVALANEAPPHAGTSASGSAAYAASLRTRQDKIACVISLESLGCYFDTPGSQKIPISPAPPWPEIGNFLALIATPPMEPALAKLVPEFTTATKLPLQAKMSGSLPSLLGTGTALTFHTAGFPVIRFTDTAGLRDPAWQSANDTPDKIDYPRLLEATRGIESTLRTLANPAPGAL